jgi:orotate phosphoribosyltransferase
VQFAYNRKEAKDHGEGGVIVGGPLKGRVLVIDDVITAGTSVRESVHLIKEAGATPAGVLIALDRMERAGPDGALSAHSAVQEVEKLYAMPVIAIATFADLLAFIDSGAEAALAVRSHRDSMLAYRARYGAER